MMKNVVLPVALAAAVLALAFLKPAGGPGVTPGQKQGRRVIFFKT
jgi:hypothetical protein